MACKKKSKLALLSSLHLAHTHFIILHCSFFQVIAAEGEQKASRALKEASEVISESSSALQLRYLQVGNEQMHNFYDLAMAKACYNRFVNCIFQTLNSISAEKNSTIIFPLPIDLISSFLGNSTSSGKSD